MGMSDYDYEEAVKYRYEYWEREGWLSTCITTMAAIGGRDANWDMLDTVGIIVGDMNAQDNNKIVRLKVDIKRDQRDETKGDASRSRDEKGEYDSKKYYDGLYEIVKSRLDYTRKELKEAEQVIEDY